MLAWFAPVLVFGLVVFVHELGHFLAAKAVGVYAPVFSLGWGRRIWGRRYGETDYRLSLFPIGGYVRMASREDEAMAALEGGTDRGELGDDVQRGEPGVPWDPAALQPFGPHPVPPGRWFESKPLWARLVVLLAGVTMNFLLAFLIVAGMRLGFGLPGQSAVIGQVLPGSAAERGGLQKGDSIVSLDDRPITRWEQLVRRIQPDTSGRPITVRFVRGGETRTLAIAPTVQTDTSPETGRPRRVARFGAASAGNVVRDPMTVGRAMAEGVRVTWGHVTSTIGVLGGLLSGEVSARNLGGPLLIAQASVQTARIGGFEALLGLLALISVNIAVLNLLPIPVLDGGQVILNVVETALGRPLGPRVRNAILYVGIGFVLLLLITTTINDLGRLGEALLGWLRR
jgi:regulator of sigma E protease